MVSTAGTAPERSTAESAGTRRGHAGESVARAPSAPLRSPRLRFPARNLQTPPPNLDHAAPLKPALRLLPILALLLSACDAAEDVRVQELPALERSTLEARLGLPELRGPWRFAGWELEAGDTLGLDAELPGFGVLFLQTQKRDSLGGVYLTAGGGRTPLIGEVRRDSVVALVALAGEGEGRFLVGEVARDTLWIETTTLSEPGSWRGDARVAFVRSERPVRPFRRVAGAVPAPQPVDSAALAALRDSLSAAGAPGFASPGAAGAPGAAAGQGTGQGVPPAARPAAPVTTAPGQAQPPAARPQSPAVTPPVTAPVTEAEAEAEQEAEAEEQPEPVPAVRREPPRVLGVPVVRDTAGGNLP